MVYSSIIYIDRKFGLGKKMLNNLAEASWLILIPTVMLLGVQHGFDLDHLATVDAMTRTTSHNKRLSRWVGVLFSFGHGIVVIVISLIIGGALIQFETPSWLDGAGKWISVIFLVLFGVLTLINMFRNKNTSFQRGSVWSLFTQKIIQKIHSPFLIVLVGALFALSFDTFSQVALFSISASSMAGWVFSGVLGVIFMLGMMISDGLNGLFVFKLIQRAENASLVTSRCLALFIAFFSLSIAILNLTQMF